MLFDFAGLVCATVIFVWSTLFERVRALWPTFFGCPMCAGFWTGLGGSIARRGWHTHPLDHFYFATCVSISAFGLYLALKRLEKPLLK
jgi:hypothetical protein